MVAGHYRTGDGVTIICVSSQNQGSRSLGPCELVIDRSENFRCREVGVPCSNELDFSHRKMVRKKDAYFSNVINSDPASSLIKKICSKIFPRALNALTVVLFFMKG